MIRIAVMNLLMHGVTEPNIFMLDTLSWSYDAFEEDEQYKYVLANPPFKGSVDERGLSDNLRIVNTRKSELLFLNRIIRMLQPEGRSAVIVPEGLLFSSTNAYKITRQNLLKNCSLEAVISLPSGVFLPYAGVKTSILVFTKKTLNSEKYHTKRVWFYELEGDGYTLDTNRKKLKDNPLPEVRDAFKIKKERFERNRKNKHFFVPIDEIINNKFELTFNLYREYVYEEEDYEPPKELLKILIKLENEILADLNELNELI